MQVPMQFCEVSGTIGAPTLEVLYTFNESTPLDTTTLGTTLYGQLGSLLGSGTYSTQFMQVCLQRQLTFSIVSLNCRLVELLP